MNIIEKINSVICSVNDLTLFVKKNSDAIFNYFINQPHSELINSQKDINDFLFRCNNIIQKLDFSINENKIFIDVLIDVSERLNLSFYFQRLCRIKEKAKLPISKRNQAAALYVNGLRNISDFSNILNDFLYKLQDAFETEEDTNKRILSIFFNFYANIIRDFGTYNLAGVKEIIDKIKENKNNYPFLISEITDEIFSIDIIDNIKAFTTIQSIIDNYLGRDVINLTYSNVEYLIESGTEYALKLKEIKSDIIQIRQLAISLYNGSDDVFYSLGRGVIIPSEEQQLFAYLKGYGNMHFAKCNYAYKNIPPNFFKNNIEIIDWGCGQALASMTYLNFIKKNNINQCVEKITLNEPSEIALKRGVIHIKKFDNNIEINTINKVLNGLKVSDFTTNNSIKLQLFSNILDIDDYSTKHLANLIKEKFKGLNYFVIISPNITDLKTNRIDNFVKEFEMNDFNLIKAENKDAGEWENNWTMVLRIFKVKIE